MDSCTKTQVRKITCTNCGGEIKRRLSLSSRTRRINLFCSKACVYEWRRKNAVNWWSKSRKRKKISLYKADVIESRPKFELKPLPGTCSQPRSFCRDCRRIFEGGCRFNNTRSFWN